jgi:predicted RNA-binding Zn ribbon-like protein
MLPSILPFHTFEQLLDLFAEQAAIVDRMSANEYSEEERANAIRDLREIRNELISRADGS